MYIYVIIAEKLVILVPYFYPFIVTYCEIQSFLEFYQLAQRNMIELCCKAALLVPIKIIVYLLRSSITYKMLYFLALWYKIFFTLAIRIIVRLLFTMKLKCLSFHVLAYIIGLDCSIQKVKINFTILTICSFSLPF